MFKKFFKIILVIIVILVIIFLSYLAYMTITDYKPEAKIEITPENNTSLNIPLNKEISLTTFNLGFCGTDKDVDFFMDGGTMSRAKNKEKAEENLSGIIDELKSLNSDLFLLQEVDKKATRSYKINQYQAICDSLKDYSSSFAVNFDVPWIPIPITEPHGQVLAGLSTLSKYNISQSFRYDLPGKENWPVQLCELDRCISSNRIPIANGKDLILINSHLSAYDKGGNIRKQQLNFLNDFLEEEYKKGNYVIIGGDWNHQLPQTDAFKFKTTEKRPDWLQDIPNNFSPVGFKWAVDSNVPSCRTIEKAYVKDRNLTAVIDGFLVSDNIEISKIQTSNLEFKNTDHNPVTLKFILK